jgi:hypothetical protein
VPTSRGDTIPRVTPNQSAVGASGVIIVATRGADGPGEVLLRMGGGTEAYLAYSEEPLPCGSEVLVFNSRGDRSVDVMQFGSGETDPLT